MNINKVGKLSKTLINYISKVNKPRSDALTIILSNQNNKITDVDNLGNTSLMIYCKRCFSLQSNIIDILRTDKIIEKTNIFKSNALMIYCNKQLCILGIAKKLVNNNTINNIDIENKNALMIYCSCDNPKIDIIDILISNESILQVDHNKNNALILYCINNPNPKMIILKKLANKKTTSHVNIYGINALSVYCNYNGNDSEIINLLNMYN
jgi:hypothetical protein